MFKIKIKSKMIFSIVLVLVGLVFFVGCDDDSDDSSGSDDASNVESAGSEFPESKTYTVKPTEYPDGVGIDFETDTSYGLDSSDIPSGWNYDIRLQTIKGEKEDGTMKGCPHIKLYKQVTKGYEYSVTGKEAFTEITADSIDESLLATDKVEEIDTDEVKNESGKYDFDLLHDYYVENFVTEDSYNWLPDDWTIEDDELIFIIKTEEGNYYKMTVLGMGTDSGTAPGGGTIEMAFEKIE